MQRGGGSKDTWIQGDGPVNEVSLLSSISQQVELSRGGGELTSRVADDLFWLGRYVQRAEGDLRIARTVFDRLLGLGRTDVLGTVRTLTRALLNRPWPIAVRRTESHRAGQGSIRSRRVRWIAAGHAARARPHSRLARSHVCRCVAHSSRQSKHDLAEFDMKVEEDQIARVVETLNRLTVGFVAFSGVVAESMTRGQAWRFLDIGMRVERAIAVARLVRSTLVEIVPEEGALLDAVLEIDDSSLTYRRRYLTQLQAPAVVDLLVADESNPRAVAFQVAALADHLAHLPRDERHPHNSPDKQAILKLRTQLQLADLRADLPDFQPGPG